MVGIDLEQAAAMSRHSRWLVVPELAPLRRQIFYRLVTQ